MPPLLLSLSHIDQSALCFQPDFSGEGVCTASTMELRLQSTGQKSKVLGRQVMTRDLPKTREALWKCRPRQREGQSWLVVK